MKRISVTDLLGWAGITVWFVASVYLSIIGNGDLFARMGSVAVALALIYFGMISRPIAAPHGYHERNALVLKTQDHLSRGAGIALARTTLLADYLNILARSQNRELPPEIEMMVGQLDHSKAIVASDNNAEHLSLVERADDIAKQGQEADVFATSVSKSLRQTEIVVAFLGTLQWGFGDLFFLSECLAC